MSKPSSTSSKPNGHWPTNIPDPEVEARANRRRFSAADQTTPIVIYVIVGAHELNC
jgi:hypothetical protein